jgi:hypothetical protein
MKTAIVSLVSLLIGIGVGWYFGYSRPNAVTMRDLRHEEAGYEVDDIRSAAFAVGAINRIDAGNTQEAVQWLSQPIADFWSHCQINPGTNEERLKLLSAIQKLSQTNQIVAAHLTNDAAFLKSLDKQMETK